MCRAELFKQGRRVAPVLERGAQEPCRDGNWAFLFDFFLFLFGSPSSLYGPYPSSPSPGQTSGHPFASPYHAHLRVQYDAVPAGCTARKAGIPFLSLATRSQDAASSISLPVTSGKPWNREGGDSLLV